MVTTHQLLGFGVAAFVLIAIPGPSVLFVIGRAFAHGRSTALLSVLGNSLGLLVVLVLVSFGLGAVVAESATVFLVLKVAGAGYLIWLGVQAIRHRRAVDAGQIDTLPASLPRGRALRQGFVVGFSNPKAFMIFAALLPQFVHRAHGQVPLQMLLLGLLAFVIGLLSDSVWALAASQLRSWFTGSPRRGRALGAAGGMSMIGLGLGLLATGRPE
ncbi:MAG TPA: LysE family translocator [Marmoricola sp.]|nr:LysE family translocator [Marmoricola sp.]